MKRTPKTAVREPKAPTRMIGLRVPPEEFERLRVHAEADSRSIASFARLLMNRGLTAYLRDAGKRK